MTTILSLSRSFIRRHAIVFGGILALGLITTPYQAAVAADTSSPTTAPSVASMSLNDILRALETKASQGKGTWTITSHLNDQAPHNWRIVVEGSNWSWQTMTPQMPSRPGLEIYSDGTQIFSLDETKRLSLPTLIQNRGVGASISPLLFLANLSPRQVFTALGTPEMAPPITVDGVTYQRIHIAASSPPSSTTATTRPTSRITYNCLYDPARQAIAQLIVGNGGPAVTECSVTDWTGTSPSWPNKVSETSSTRRPNGQQIAGAATLSSVTSYEPADVSGVQEAKSRVDKTPCFVTADEDLRSVDFYRQALKANPNQLSDQLALAQAMLLAKDVQGGIREWTSLRQVIKEGASRTAIDHTLGALTANALWNISSDKTKAAESLSGLQTLSKYLPDDEWASTALPTFEAYRLLTISADSSDQIKQLAPLLDQVAQSKDVAALVGMILLAHQSPTQAAVIEPALDRVIGLSVSGPLADKPNAAVLNAAIVLGDIPRTKRYLAAIHFDASAADNQDKAELSAISTAMDLSAKLQVGNLSDIPDSVKWLISLKTAMSADPHLGFSVARWLQTSIATIVTQAMKHNQLGNLEAAIKQTTTFPDAVKVWEQVLLNPNVQGAGDPVALLNLGQYCEDTFHTQGLRSKILLSLGNHTKNIKGASPAKALEFYDKALALAPDDSVRISILAQIVAVHGNSGHFDLARQTIHAIEPSISTTGGKKAIAALLMRIEDQEDLSEQKIAAAKTRQDQVHLQGQLAFLQGRLMAAQKQGSSEEIISSIQHLIDNTQLALRNNKDIGNSAVPQPATN